MSCVRRRVFYHHHPAYPDRWRGFVADLREKLSHEDFEDFYLHVETSQRKRDPMGRTDRIACSDFYSCHVQHGKLAAHVLHSQ